MIQRFAHRALPVLGFGLLALAILSTAGCAGRDRYYTPYEEGGVSRTVQRPILSQPAVKPLYVGGYAGATYGRRGGR